MVVRPPCCPKLGILSSANSARAQEMWLLMPSSQVQAQGVLTRQEEPHHRRSPDLKMCSKQCLNLVVVCLLRANSFSTIVVDTRVVVLVWISCFTIQLINWSSPKWPILNNLYIVGTGHHWIMMWWWYLKLASKIALLLLSSYYLLYWM